MAVRTGNFNNNTLNGTSERDYIWGYGGDDILSGLAGSDIIYGGAGDDQILDGRGADRLLGEDGNDIFTMTSLANGDAADSVNGGRGFDFVEYVAFLNNGQRDATLALTIDLLDNSKNRGLAKGDVLTSIEGFIGSAGRDDFSGTDEGEVILASLGNDIYRGRGGFDSYYAYQRAVGDPVAGSIEVEIAFGTRAQTLAASIGRDPGAGAGIAFYTIWRDTSGDGLKQPNEVTRQGDILFDIDRFVGTMGADKIVGSAADEEFAPVGGEDFINGGGGFDFLVYDQGIDGRPWGQWGGGVPAVEVDLSANEAIVGGATSRILGIEGVVGTFLADQIVGNAFDNILYGMDGEDAVDGGAGADKLFGGTGNDLMIGGPGNDILFGGVGDDIADGSGGSDTLAYVYAPEPIAISLLRGKGSVPVIDGTPFNNSWSVTDVVIDVENVVGSRHDDIIVGSDADNLLEGRPGSDLIQGCEGDDIIYGETAPNSAVEEYFPGPDFDDENILDDCGCGEEDGHGHHDQESGGISYADELEGGGGDDGIFGGLGDDEIDGCEGEDRLFGEASNDLIYGAADNDLIDGGEGTDILYGGSGDDRISGGQGFDIVFGGHGIDTADYSASGDAVVVDLGQFWRNSGGDASGDLIAELLANLDVTDDTSAILDSTLFLSIIAAIGDGSETPSFTLALPDVLLGIESVTGSAFDDEIVGNLSANTLDGGNGDDLISGLGGSDTLNGGIGADVMSGGNGNDTITGGANIDALAGDAGNDILSGGTGNDRLNGGSGDDTFQFDTALGGNVDTIEDFAAANDTIALSRAIFAQAGLKGTLAGSAFALGTGAADASDRIIYDGTTGRIFYDSDGTGSAAAVLFAQVTAGTTLTNADFLLYVPG